MRLGTEGAIVIRGRDHIELIAGSFAVHGGEEMIGERELLSIIPEGLNAGDGVVVKAHGDVALGKGKFIHGTLVEVGEISLVSFWEGGGRSVSKQEGRYRLSRGIHLREAGNAGTQAFDGAAVYGRKLAVQVVEADVLQNENDHMLNG